MAPLAASLGLDEVVGEHGGVLLVEAERAQLPEDGLSPHARPREEATW